MRILFLTNFYPPHELGGQGRSCQQVVDAMQARGHETWVLTSMNGTNNMPVEEEGVARLLYLEMDFAPMRHHITFFTERKGQEQHNLACFAQVYERFAPDVVFVWGMWNFARSLPAFVEQKTGGKLLYRFAEYWPTLPSQHVHYWQAPGKSRVNHLTKQVLGKVALAMLAREKTAPLKFEHAFCVSAGTRQELVDKGVPLSHARVIYTGLDESWLGEGVGHEACSVSTHAPRPTPHSLRLLYAGRLDETKGVETAIEAMGLLVREHGLQNIEFEIAGTGADVYVARLKQLVDKEGVGNCVRFLGKVDGAKMPALMRSHDIILVTSIWPEPFARVILEGMVSGMVVVSTPTGGSAEIVEDGKTGLLFPPANAHTLAEKIAMLAHDPDLRERLATAGQTIVRERFTKTRMIDEMEDFLLEIAEGNR
jgi:glycosyltransferase involved in cell wall biosynthesis